MRKLRNSMKIKSIYKNYNKILYNNNNKIILKYKDYKVKI